MVQVHQGDQEDEDDWAREQLRKGVGLPADQMPSTSGRGGAGGNGRVMGPALALAARPQTEVVAAAGEEVLKALRQGLARLQARNHTCCCFGFYLFWVKIPGTWYGTTLSFT